MNRTFLAFLLSTGCSLNTTTPSGDEQAAADTTVRIDSRLQNPTDSTAPSSNSGGTTPDTVPIIDFHAHVLVSSEHGNLTYIDALVAAMDESGVEKIALSLHARQPRDRPPTYSQEHDTWTLAAYKRHPDRVIPMLAGVDPDDPGAVEYVREQLETGLWAGLGEFDLRNAPKGTATPANHASMMQIYALAGVHDVPVLIHFESCYQSECSAGEAELVEALTAYPGTIFMTAHDCMPELMKIHENLWCEYEFPPGTIPTGLSDRIVLGTDMQKGRLITHEPQTMKEFTYGEVVEMLREDLAADPTLDVVNIAHGNARRLLE